MKAFYDNKPSAFEAVGNGDWLYRRDIREEEVPAMGMEGEDSEKEPRKQWACDEVVVHGEPDYGKCVSAVIRDAYTIDEELALINKHASYQKGISEDDTIVDEYGSYLQFVAAVKAQVKQDLAEVQPG